MPLTTTTLGAYPKPAYVPIADWFQGPEGTDTRRPTEHYTDSLRKAGEDAERLFQKAAADVIKDQIDAGVRIPTDGEVRRENYIHYHCRHLQGIDFNTLTEKPLRTGNYSAELPTVTAPVKAGASFLPHDFAAAQAACDLPVKVTVPGPFTIGDTIADRYYGSLEKLGADLAVALNREILALAAAGCRYIQVDEPVFARMPEQALDFGFKNLHRAVADVPDGVHLTVHMCCGYPDLLDSPNMKKAPLRSYLDLAEVVESGPFHAISLEDAHRYNDLSDLLPRYRNTTVVLGTVAVASNRIEPVEEIRARLQTALRHIDAERLWAAPDCGLGLLGTDLARQKLSNMCAAAMSI